MTIQTFQSEVREVLEKNFTNWETYKLTKGK